MATTAATDLKQLLRNLCYNSPWKYAVFWKVDQETGMVLTWEDGFFDHTKPCQSLEKSGNDDFHVGGYRILSFEGEVDDQVGSFPQCPIEMAVRSMACYSYLLGERKIGEVAYGRKNCWIFASELRSKLSPEFSEEWEPQLLAGIKTVLLVPIDHKGVLQLGSLTKVLEDGPRVMNLIRTLLDSYLHTGPAMPLPPVTNFAVSLSPSPVPLINNDLLDGISPAENIIDFVYPEESISKLLPVGCRLMMPFTVHPNTQELQVTNMKSETSSHGLLQERIKEFETDQFQHSDESDLSSVTQSFCRWNSEPSIKIESSHRSHLENAYDQHFSEKCVEDNFGVVNNSITSDSDLNKALLGFLENEDIDWSSILSNIDGLNGQKNEQWEDIPGATKLYAEKSDTHFMNDPSVRHIIDELIADLNYCSDDEAQGATRSIESYRKPSITDECITGAGDNCLMRQLHVRSMSSFEELQGSICLPSNSEKIMKDKALEQSMDCKAFNKKRGRTPDSYNPRPRDRQLIQDRVKELREIIPNGSKCSIDGLLDKTIQHMHFLQNVSELADKLKQCTNVTQPKLQLETEDTSLDSGGDNNHQSGTSRAFKYGNNSKDCKLIVENLEESGQMLVEMLCKDYSLFLEIAQVIKQMELTILKGVLEKRSNELWAHFIIEATNSFHRMNVLWPLMHLAQRNYKNNSSRF